MRASKESCQIASDDLDYIERQCGRLFEQPERINAAQAKRLNCAFELIREFMAVAKRRLPTEASYDRDKIRKRRHSAKVLS